MDTRPLRMLSGSEIVARGKNMADCILPEVGLKEISPNGSWLEKKQIQTALESRKALVAAERINKLETLSHAEWIDTLRLAKVTQLSGGHWQYLGHNINGTMYLLPEETLYLMEVNSLLLKHNEVPVSLQKAYSLLLDDQMSLTQYKVYASLSRVGYKVFRHERLNPSTPVTKIPLQKPLSKNNDIAMDLDYDGNSNLLDVKGVPYSGSSDILCITSDMPVSAKEVTSSNCSMANDNDSITESVEYALLNNSGSTNEFTTTVPDDDDLNMEIEEAGSKKDLKNISDLSQSAKKEESTSSVDPVASNDSDSNTETEKSLDSTHLPTNESTPLVAPVISDAVDSNMKPEKSLDSSHLPTNEESIEKTTSSIDPVVSNGAVSNMKPETLDSSYLPTNEKSIEKTTPSFISNDVVSNMEPETLDSSHLPTNEESIEKTTPSIDPVVSNDAVSNMEPETLDSSHLPTNEESIEKITPSIDPVVSNDADSNMEPEKSLDSAHLPTNEESIEKTSPSIDPIISNDVNSNMEPETLNSSDLPTNEKSTEKYTLSDDQVATSNADSNIEAKKILDSLHIQPVVESTEKSTLSVDHVENTMLMKPHLTDANDDVAMDCAMLIDEPAETQTNGLVYYSENELLNSKATFSIDSQGVIRVIEKVVSSEIETVTVSSATPIVTENADADKTSQSDKPRPAQNPYRVRQWKIENRKLRSTDPNILQETFKTVPNFHNQQTVTINVPNEQYLPRNISLNNKSYVISVSKLKSEKRLKPSKTNKPNRALRNSSETVDLPSLLQRTPIPSLRSCFVAPVWRPQYQMFQGPILPRHPFHHAFLYRPIFPSYQSAYRMNARQTNKRPNFQLPKRQRDSKSEHLNAIKHCAQRLKQFGIPPQNCRESLEGLVNRFNEIYNERIQITPDYNIIENIEVIDLDDDEVPSKKLKLSNEKFELYLGKVKALASRLKNLQRKNQPASKYKRAFSNLLKHFNDTFEADFYLNPKGELIDRKLVVLDSSSDSDVVATDDLEPRKTKKRRAVPYNNSPIKKKKVLPNPFSIAINKASVNPPVELNPTSAKDLPKYFHKNWIPSEDDFGKPVLSSKTDGSHSLEDSQKLYEFMDDPESFNSWDELKLSYYSKMAAIFAFEMDLSTHSRHMTSDESRLKPILDYSFDDWTTSLEKLRIIKTNTDVEETSLRIDFDVYNRDVQNFKKTDPPKPHFRIVCVEECSPFPSGGEVRALHSRHDDVTIVFAIVGAGSITYLKINPTELPVYFGND